MDEGGSSREGEVAEAEAGFTEGQAKQVDNNFDLTRGQDASEEREPEVRVSE